MRINAIIANTGNGTVTTGDVNTGDIHQENSAMDRNRDEFLKILQGIKSEVQSIGDNSAKEAVEIIQNEIHKESWNKKIMNFMLDSLQKTGVTLAAKGLETLVSQALALLPLI